jgi:hypothetical protein
MTTSPLFLVFQISQKLVATDSGFASDRVDVVGRCPAALDPAAHFLRRSLDALSQFGLAPANLHGAVDGFHSTI